MLRATSVEITLSSADLEQAIAAQAPENVESLKVTLADGAILVALEVGGDKLPMKVPVELRLTIERAYGQEIAFGVTWSNLALLPGFLKNLALQRAFEALPGTYENGLFVVDTVDVLEHLPVSFRIVGVQVEADGVRVRLADVVAFPVDPTSLIEAPGRALVPVPSTEEARIPEHQDFYQRLRAKVRKFTVEKAPKWAQPLVPWVLAVPDFFVMMVRLARDPRVPTGYKVMAGVVVAYFISPVDLIPDPIPIIGELDDLAVAIFALDQMQNAIDRQVIEEAWPGEGEVLALVSEGVELFTKVFPGKMLLALKRVLKRK